MAEEKKHVRPSWDEYFMEVARTVGTRGTCDRGRSGSVIVKDKRILTTGYVGSPVGIPHCDEIGHEMHEVYDVEGKKHQHCVRTSHAEENAISQAAQFGVSIVGGTVYCKMEPCYTCTKMIINSGIKRVVAEKQYHGAYRSRKVMKEAGVELVVLNEELEQYENQ